MVLYGTIYTVVGGIWGNMKNNTTPYAEHSPFSDPGPLSDFLDDVPDSVPAVCASVQSLLLNFLEAYRYGVQVPEKDRTNADIENVAELLAGITALDDRPLSLARSPQERLPVVCRQFAILTCSILRHKGVAARTRAGFADYLPPDAYVAHSICEYWNGVKECWIRIDPQIDDVHRSALEIDFDPLDIPAARYLAGPEAWHAVRSGAVPVERFDGGMACIRNLVALDFLQVNCLETHQSLPSIIANPGEPPSIAESQVLDCVTNQILAGQNSFETLRLIYSARSEFQIANHPMQPTPEGAPDG